MKRCCIMSVQGYLQALIIRISEPTPALHDRDPVKHTGSQIRDASKNIILRAAQRSSPFMSVLAQAKAASTSAQVRMNII